MEQSLRTSHGAGSPSPSGDRLRKAIERNRAKRAKKNPQSSNQAIITPPPPQENPSKNSRVDSNRQISQRRGSQRRVPPRRSSAPAAASVNAPADIPSQHPDHLRDTLEEIENFDDFDVYDEEDDIDEEDFEELPSERSYRQASPPKNQRSTRPKRPIRTPQKQSTGDRSIPPSPPPPRRGVSTQGNLRREKQTREIPRRHGLDDGKKEVARPPRTGRIDQQKKPFPFPAFIQKRIDGVISFLGPRDKWLSLFKKLSWLVCFFLLGRLVLSDRGVLDYFSQKKNYEKKVQKLSYLNDYKLDLKREIKLIKNNKFHQKKLVRDHLGFISKDEFLILFQKGK